MKTTQVVMEVLWHLSVDTTADLASRMMVAEKQIRDWAGQAETDDEKRCLLEALDKDIGQVPRKEFWSDMRGIVGQCLNELPAPS
jgi:hypothetical protein